MTDPLKIFDTINDKHIIMVIMLFALISPTIATLLLFFQTFILEVNFVTLIIIILSFGLASCLPSSILLFGFEDQSKPKPVNYNNSFLKYLGFVAVLHSITFFIVLAVYYIFYIKHGFLPFFIIALIIVFVLSPSIVIIDHFHEEYKKKKAEKKLSS